ncbi:RimK family alpha-L-glutamate ligase [Spongisporangium articulatum]|uniref:RimK family alpha-L-glutamate ligase n=1 Tax=Spongisporangium articulatum TaxID=3362603 RepID=A0ABW8AN99_9ACTN
MIGIVTTDLSAFPFGDEDLPHLFEALDAAGLEARALHWRDDDIDWGAYDLAVLRSPWDYPFQVEDFLAWTRRVAGVTTLANPAPVVAWNSDKRYLAELAANGVATVPTRYATNPAELGTALVAARAGSPSGELVVKPSVSAGSDLTGRFGVDDPAASVLVERIWAAGKVAMVQPYLPSVGRRGELAVMHIDGVYSHAVRKGPILDSDGRLLGGSYREDIEAAVPSERERAAADDVLARLPGWVTEAGPLLYARIDLVEADDGSLALLELELIEPSLFFPAVPAAAGRLAAAIASRV